MSGWFNAKNLTSFASSALKEAQKRLDKALDIQEEDLLNPQTPLDVQSPTSASASATKKQDNDFWNSWNLDSETGVVLPAAKKSVSTTKLPADVTKADSPKKQPVRETQPETQWLSNTPERTLSSNLEADANWEQPAKRDTQAVKDKAKQAETRTAKSSSIRRKLDKENETVQREPVPRSQAQESANQPMEQSLLGDWATGSRAFDTASFSEVQFEAAEQHHADAKAEKTRLEAAPTQLLGAMTKSVVGDWNVEASAIDDQLVTMLNSNSNPSNQSETVSSAAAEVATAWNPDAEGEIICTLEAQLTDSQKASALKSKKRKTKRNSADEAIPLANTETVESAWNIEAEPQFIEAVDATSDTFQPSESAVINEVTDVGRQELHEENNEKYEAAAVADADAQRDEAKVTELETSRQEPESVVPIFMSDGDQREPVEQSDKQETAEAEGVKHDTAESDSIKHELGAEPDTDNATWSSTISAATSRSTMQESASSTSTLTSIGAGVITSVAACDDTPKMTESGSDSVYFGQPPSDTANTLVKPVGIAVDAAIELSDSMLQSVTSNLEMEIQGRQSESDSMANVDNENVESASPSASASSDRESLSASDPQATLDSTLRADLPSQDHIQLSHDARRFGTSSPSEMMQSEQFEKLGPDSDQVEVDKSTHLAAPTSRFEKQMVGNEFASSGDDYTSSDIEVLSSAASTTGEYVNYALHAAMANAGGLLVRAPVVARQPATDLAFCYTQHTEADTFRRAAHDREECDRERQMSTSTLIAAPASPPTSESAGGSSNGNGNGHSSSSEASSSSIVVIGSDRDRLATSPERDDDPDYQHTLRAASLRHFEETTKLKSSASMMTESTAVVVVAGGVAFERMSRNEMIRKLRELSETLAVREQKVLDLSRELNEHRDTIEQLESKVKHENSAEQSALIGELQTKVADISRELESVRRSAQTAEQRLTAKHDAEQQKIITKYEAERRRLVDTVREKDEQIAQFAVEGERLSKREMQFELKLKELRAKERETSETLQSQTERLAKQNAELEKLRSAIETHKETEQRNVEAIAQLQRVVQKQEKDLLRYRSELDDATEKSRSLQTTLDSAYRELSESRKQLAARDTQLAERAAEQLRDERDELVRRVDSLRTDSEKRELALLAQTEELRAALQRVDGERTARELQLKRELNDLQIKVQESEARNEQLSQSVSMTTRPLLRQLEHLQTRLNQQTSAYETLEAQTSERIRTLTAQLAAARENDSLHDETVSTLQSRISQLEQKLTNASQERARLLANVEELEQAKMDAEQKAERLTVKLEAAKERANKTSSEAKRELVAVEAQLDTERLQTATLQKRVAALEEQLERARVASIQHERETDRSSSGRHASVASPTLMTNSLILSSSGSVLNSPAFPSIYDKVRSGLAGNTSTQTLALSVLDNLQAQLKQKDGEIAQLQAEIGTLQSSRAALTQELAAAIGTNEQLKDGAVQLETLRAEHAELTQRYNEMLTMYGEKVEEANELRLDVADIKELYRSQLEELLKLRSALAYDK